MTFRVSLILAFLATFSSNAFLQTNFWNDISSSDLRSFGTSFKVEPHHYRSLELNVDELVNLLRSAPKRNGTIERGILIEIPMPSGEFEVFEVFESPLMAPSLQSAYPSIRTFTGAGKTLPNANIFLDMSPEGFHAMILAPGKSIFIDPMLEANNQIYACYHKQHYKRLTSSQSYSCGMETSELILPSSSLSVAQEQRNTAVSLITYEVAISASAEYTAFHGGTKVSALAAINTTLNRVRGIYETELAITFQLVANNSDVIYTDVNSDPYTSPPNPSININEVHTAIDNAIGSGNYDFGHLFTTGNGGIANLGCVCDNSNKGRGVTGSAAPAGDPFDVDFVTHEIGHQFGAAHTFNGSTGSCNGNRTATSAYEPGSGSSLMSYAGICTTQNIQHKSNSYFHLRSLTEIQTYVVDGEGNTCSTLSSSGNNAPTVNADPNSMNGKTIPANTPFELEASGSDPDGHSLTYNWEQYDLGAAGAPAANLTTGPIFKSYSPSSSTKRVFPKLDDILDGSNGNEGEFLPSVSRSLTFECTVRDNQTAGGGFAHNSITVHVDNSASDFAIANHNSPATVEGNITLNWNVGNTTAAPVSCSNVDIYLSVDGGISFSSLKTNTPNDGVEEINLPGTLTGLARLKVKCSDNIFFDINNADLRMAPADATCNELVANPSFESGYANWTAYSSNGYGLLGNYGINHDGTVSALMGGGDNETSRLSQTISIPSGAHFSALTFWHKTEEFDCGGDIFNVKINGTIVQTVDLCSTAGTTDWEREIVDLSAYKGTSPTIMLELVCNGAHDTWMYLDDLSVFVCEGGTLPLLPVEMARFDVQANQNKGLLNWTTVQEKGNLGFDVEMRKGNQPFKKIGFVHGAGTSNVSQNYQFRTHQLTPGLYYFRLKQLDENGQFNYSEMKQLFIDGQKKLNVFPNPTNHMLFFELTHSTEQQVEIEIFDAMGHSIDIVTKQSFAPGQYKIPYEVNQLPTGVYFYKMSALNDQETGRFVVEE